jgi:hypothetical protein
MSGQFTAMAALSLLHSTTSVCAVKRPVIKWEEGKNIKECSDEWNRVEQGGTTCALGLALWSSHTRPHPAMQGCVAASEDQFWVKKEFWTQPSGATSGNLSLLPRGRPESWTWTMLRGFHLVEGSLLVPICS